MESIPLKPASATEGASITSSFGRTSSFSRVRINGRNTKVGGASNTSAISINSGKCRSGFLLFFSLLGVMCAILWVLIGSSVRVMGLYSSNAH